MTVPQGLGEPMPHPYDLTVWCYVCGRFRYFHVTHGITYCNVCGKENRGRF